MEVPKYYIQIQQHMQTWNSTFIVSLIQTHAKTRCTEIKTTTTTTTAAKQPKHNWMTTPKQKRQRLIASIMENNNCGGRSATETCTPRQSKQAAAAAARVSTAKYCTKTPEASKQTNRRLKITNHPNDRPPQTPMENCCGAHRGTTGKPVGDLWGCGPGGGGGGCTCKWLGKCNWGKHRLAPLGTTAAGRGGPQLAPATHTLR